ncbi:sulfotransferase [Aestuariicella hydrocarbonica]|uniref:Sulfotransferase n=1 Tax=Pseudomaricurvus hydrocarbonicus TaxID=1470433 RepID=A0A9E5MMD8_9GAMM|nr:sulfotransferase [Aestuariicella hydrocarbonica]NHO66095.1 sulfotransferase [Aestuariicella hydrocarbonica]
MSNPRLELPTLLLDAQQQTGLSDFGDDSFREACQRLLWSLNTEANLNDIGRDSQYQRILTILKTRLRFAHYLKQYPQILDEVIEPPLVIVGLPRTGTTLLQRMLATDPRFYSAMYWETLYPVPLEDIDFSQPEDPRIDAARAQVQMMLDTVPELAAIHPLEAEAADEEITLLEQSFFSTNPEAMANVPGFGAWLEQQDQSPGYRYLKQLLQFLQWQKKQRGHSARRWVLKSPHHIHCIDSLFAEFPDAQVIQTHRDPLQTIPSLASFIHHLWQLGSDQADPLAVGEQWHRKMAAGLHKTLEFRQRQHGDRFLDVRFIDTVERPLAVIEAIYQFADMPLTAETRTNIENWRARNHRDQRAPHHYSLAQFGLSEPQMDRDYRAYRDTYIHPEKV